MLAFSFQHLPELDVQIEDQALGGDVDPLLTVVPTYRRWLGGAESVWRGDLVVDGDAWERLVRRVLEALDAGMTPEQIVAEP